MTYDWKADAIGSYLVWCEAMRSLLETLSREHGEDEAREIVRKRVERGRE